MLRKRCLPLLLAATARTLPYMQGWRDGCSWAPALCSPAWHHHHCAGPVLQHAHSPQGEHGVWVGVGLLRNCAPAPVFGLTPRHVPSASSSRSGMPAGPEADVGVQVHVLIGRNLTAKQACKSSLTTGAALERCLSAAGRTQLGVSTACRMPFSAPPSLLNPCTGHEERWQRQP